jgi:hypothetical protein
MAKNAKKSARESLLCLALRGGLAPAYLLIGGGKSGVNGIRVVITCSIFLIAFSQIGIARPQKYGPMTKPYCPERIRTSLVNAESVWR